MFKALIVKYSKTIHFNTRLEFKSDVIFYKIRKEIRKQKQQYQKYINSEYRLQM